ncbi:uncharacterized protein LOC116254467 isoform X2 [Nymphaea colorata]|uniref:uncharacterized protein LOC116254467 isoform X2 n=1 Tax=Nymphaea colorata TaxID=210225 RepID=UPI00129D2BBB|nr:uncharacterized protein LOC116254467 isoform X2 [Nymphaea colorata]
MGFSVKMDFTRWQRMILGYGFRFAYQLCSQMIFNHDQPRCFRCEGCGGSLYCGNKCSALVSINNAGYRVCTSIGQASKSHITLIDERRPKIGVVIKMSSVTEKMNCSLSVSVFCDQSATVPTSVDHVGGCDYATTMRHPAACADVISGGRSGLGWFGTLITVLICLLGAYLLAGTVYRFLFLGVRGVEVIPNLSFWLRLPQQAQILVCSLVRKFSGQVHLGRGSYSQIN